MKLSALGRIALATGIAVLATATLPGTPAAAAPVKRKILPVLVEFSDASFQFPDKVKASTPDTYFGAKSDSAASYLSEVSRGQYTVVPAVKEQFLGPIKLNLSAAGCPQGKINQMTREELTKRGLVAGKDYESLSIVFPAQKTNCPWAGLATMPGPTTWINLYGTASGIDVVGHELGHNLGFGHQGRFLCTGGDLGSCKSDGSSYKSIMGAGYRASGFSAPELIRAGWLPGGASLKVTKSGVYTLRSLHGKGSGTRALDIALGGDRLVIEYRHAAGTLDAKIEGVHAYRVPKGSYGASSLIDTTVENKTAANDAPSNTDAIKKLTDKANKVSVAVVSSGGGQAKVKVALNGDSLSAIDATPSKSATPTPSAATPTPSASTDTEAVTDGSEPVTEFGSGELTATGGRSTTLPLAVGGGAALLAAGAGFLLLKRRRKRA
ncbi:LPXTG cell wall anchor domain-containing protein [Micromonospora sp. LH3U1]|uniref:LPXTG cell wall anchor domain-containing protein n=1 Tax=Micromonospora sp. LH3U1 TaxID=3018339 RepID=UPI00234A69B0|nr:LPXTG cell wall anchor domain-containing protein [Micromonospora sp. LH3U1]WCN79033.1 LPXTG cell wall anchor domain-containing protein [Micromonospora sp. LH3U1]